MRTLAVERSKLGYTLNPGFAFAASADGTLSPVTSQLLMIIYARPRGTPYLTISVDETDVIELPQVACPAPL